MALSAQQLLYLKTADQRFRAHVQVFPAWNPVVTPPVVSSTSGTKLAPKPMVVFGPRYSTVNNSASIDIYVGDSYLRGGGAASTKNWSVDVGSLSAATGDTVTFTAPAIGSGVATITVTCANAAGTTTSYAYVAYPKTTYDETVAEIAAIQGSLTQHGWKATLRLRGASADFTIGKRVLIHIEDTWDTTTSTFGGYKYPEGVLVGYITETEYFEDWTGEQWLGIEVQSPWWILGRVKVGELWWGTQAEGGKLYLTGFTPVDAIWKLVQDVTDFAKQHNVTLWFDTNTIDDFITEESDLATLFDDIMTRTLSITYCDRYGSLFCVPDPDVRADEYWGTPASTYTLTSDYVMSYAIKTQPYQVRKLILAAFQSSKIGIFAISENPTAQGDINTMRGLLCDSNLALVNWAVGKRGQLNRSWWIEATHPLNHILDLNNFVDAVFTAPSQSGAPTASGQCYADSISYRPDGNGGWQGNIRYLKRTEGEGEAESGAVSGWGGTGSYWPGRSGYSGSGYYGSGGGGWINPPVGPTSWCYVFDFVNSGGGGWGTLGTYTVGGVAVHTPGTGWINAGASGTGFTGRAFDLTRNFPSRVITQVDVWLANPDVGIGSVVYYLGNVGDAGLYTVNGSLGTAKYTWTGVATSNGLIVDQQAPFAVSASHILSARIYGSGTSPFGSANC